MRCGSTCAVTAHLRSDCVHSLQLRPSLEPSMESWSVADTFVPCAHLPAVCSWYYVKSYAEGSGIVRLPAGIV